MSKFENFQELLSFADKAKEIAARPEPERGKYGWYQIHDRVVDQRTGVIAPSAKPDLWRRATTDAGKLDSKANLVDWKARMAALGVARNPDIASLLADHEIDDIDRDTKDAQMALVEEACDRIGGGDAAKAGTAMHAINEAIDLSLIDPSDVPLPYRRDVLARLNALEQAGIVLPADKVELILLNETVQLAGMTDRIAEYKGQLLIFDDKTGKSLHPKAQGAQLGIYANSQWIYNPVTKERTPMFEVSKERGLICHTPAGTGVCTIHEIDIDTPYRLLQDYLACEKAQLSWQIGYAVGPAMELEEQLAASLPQEKLEHHTDVVKVAEPTPVAEVLPAALAGLAVQAGEDPFIGLPRPEGGLYFDRAAKQAYLEARIAKLKAFRLDGEPDREIGVEYLAALWYPAIPPFPKGQEIGHEYTCSELEAIDRLLWDIEGQLKVSFPDDVDPIPENITIPGDDVRIQDLKDIVDALPPDLQANVGAWLKTEKIPQPTGGRLTEAQFPRVVTVVERAAVTAQVRVEKAAEFFEAASRKGISQYALLSALGIQRPNEITGVLQQRLQLLVGACLIDWLRDNNGTLAVTDDAPAQLLANFDNKRNDLIAAARVEAKRNELKCPASADEILVDPLLVAVLTAA